MDQVLYQLRQLEQKWNRTLSWPDWYRTVIPEIQTWSQRVDHEQADHRAIAKSKLYDFFEDRLVRKRISLGAGRGFDIDRKAIDTVVLHHTSNPPNLRPSRLSAIELIRLYAPYFMNPTARTDSALKGQAVFSGHVRHGQQVFWPYHWIIREDGVPERLLEDFEIGWHAGDWDINCRSVAIVLDGDFEWRRPPGTMLRAVVQIISQYYSAIEVDRIFGHREITPKTTCPSRLFLSTTGSRGWKHDVTNLLDFRKAA